MLRWMIRLLFVSLLLLSGTAQASGILRGSAGAPSFCTPADGDTMNEGFEQSGYELAAAWTEVITGTGDLDEDNLLTNSPPAGACSEGLLVYVNTGEGYTVARWDNGSTITRTGSIDIYAEFQIFAATLPAQYDNFGILSWDDDTTYTDTGAGGFVRLSNESGSDLNIYASSATASTKTVIATDTWYTLHLHLDGTAANSYFQLDGGTQYTFTRADTADGQYLNLGVINGFDADEAVDMQWGRVWINTP